MALPERTWTPSRFSRLSTSRQQRHHAPMMADLLLQFVVEVLRSLLAEELSSRVRRRAAKYMMRRHARHRSEIGWREQLRLRKRPLHRLRTEELDNR